MADAGSQARIQDLKRRIALDPSSRLFVALAEEYRKAGRLGEALSTLQQGLLSHPNYLSAQVALGRAYQESGQATEAIATFSKVLAADPGNLVSAKSLAEIYLGRGETVEAIKKYKLYRAISGDRTVDGAIARIEKDLAPPPRTGPMPSEAPVPPPPSFLEAPSGPIAGGPRRDFSPEPASPPADEPFDLSPVAFDIPPPVTAPAAASPLDPFGSAEDADSAPIAPAAPPPASIPASEAATQAFRVSDILGGSETPPARSKGADAPGTPAPEGEPQGRTLADLYFAQGHYAEALRIYDELVSGNPFDDELRRLRRDAEARLLPAGTASAGGTADPAFDRRLKRIRALRQWLSVLQAG